MKRYYISLAPVVQRIERAFPKRQIVVRFHVGAMELRNLIIMFGKTIQIYLPNGDPKSVKQASITTDKIEVIQISRSILSQNKDLSDFKVSTKM